MIETVLLDMDGVLVDFVSGVAKFHKINHPYDSQEAWGRWDFYNLIGLSYEEIMSPLTVEFWANLDWMPGGKKLLEVVEERFGKENICILSNPSGCSKAMEGKLRWLEKHVPEYKSRYLFGPSKHFAGHINRLLIDDADHNVLDYLKHGFPALLVPRPWNKRNQENITQFHEELRFYERI